MTQTDERTLFLSGASGPAGCCVAARLLEEGWRLRCLLRPGSANRLYLPNSPALEIVEGNFDQPQAWAAHLHGVAAYIHMGHIGYLPAVIPFLEQTGVPRVISFSSTRRFTRFPDSSARRVMAGETALGDSNLNYTILRSAMIYSPQRDNNLQKIVRWLSRCRVMPLVAGGRNLLQPIYALDLAAAVVCALARPEQTGRRALTVAGPQTLTQRALTETIGRLIGRPVIWLPVPYPLMMAAAWSLETAARLTGRKPLVSRAQVRRLLEDKTFDLTETRAALGEAWNPRPFEEGFRKKLAAQK